MGGAGVTRARAGGSAGCQHRAGLKRFDLASSYCFTVPPG